MTKKIYLNDLEGFHWVSAGNNQEGFGKASICNESFWLRECQQDEKGLWHGIVDNELLCTDKHGLCYDDTVTFNIGRDK